MSNVLSDLILFSQANTDLSIWPFLAASTLVATMIMRRRRID